MAKTVVGTFDNVQDAERTAARLENSGVERRSIAIIDNRAGRDSEGRWKGKSGGFWSWLFGDVEEEQGHVFPAEDSQYYSEQLGRGAAFVTVTTTDENASRIRDLMERAGAQDVRAQQGNLGLGAPRSRSETEQVVPVVEEQLKVGKRAVTRGGVRIYRHITERPVEEHMRLREERIRVERRPVDRDLDRSIAQPFQEQTIDLTETAEEPIVEKRARIVEEVVVGRDVDEREATVRETVRRGDVDVERTGAPRAFGTMESDFRQHWTRSFNQTGLTYEQCSPAYRYGYELADNKKYPGEWTVIEPDIRRDWEQRNPGTWERFKAAIRYAWDRGRGKIRAA